MDMKKLAPMIAAIVLVVGGGSFYGGIAYAKGKASDRGGNFNRAAGTAGGTVGSGGFRGQSGARMGGGFTAGEILSKDDTSITVKLMDGGSKIVFLADTTKINKSTDGTKDDLAVGTQVVVMGASGTDGSVTATSVQIGSGLGFARPVGGQPAK
ncbi:MAG: hypothetical protein AAB554_00155 [Patescibacteria group bacterium]